MAGGFSSDPFVREAHAALERIVRHGVKASDVETPTLDCKEEAGRRVKGAYGPGSPKNEEAAKALADAAACLANTDGGVLVVGVDDKASGPDALVGADLDAEWVRERIWDLTEPHLGAEVGEMQMDGTRLLLVLVRRGYRLIRSGKKFKHRVRDKCVEMTPEEQRVQEEAMAGFDWSAQTSQRTLDDVSEAAVDRIRSYLRAAADESRQELAGRPTADLLRRLGIVEASGRLNNAGAVLVTPGDRVIIDYKRRKIPGGASLDRVEVTAPLIEAYHDVKQRIDAVNEFRELQLSGGVRPRIRLIPDSAAREGLVNALIHRDYRHADPVDVEFVDAQLVIVSPGGFPPGIDESNILTERSHPRNKVLADVFRSLRLAEQEGVGVDRMFRDMVNVGHEVPSIADRNGRVRCVLIGGEPSEPVVRLLASFPSEAQEDVDLALILHVLLDRANVSPGELTGILQKLEGECAVALGRGEKVGLLQHVSWSTRKSPRWRLSDTSRTELKDRLPYMSTSSEDAEEFIVRHLLTNSTIRPKEVADLLGLANEQSGSRILRKLREEGVVEFGSSQTRGRGVFHVPGPGFEQALERHGLAPTEAGGRSHSGAGGR